MTTNTSGVGRINLARDWESTFSFWAQSPSKTEQERCERVIRAINKAVSSSPTYKKGSEPFKLTSGSVAGEPGNRLPYAGAQAR
jgi:hypothetical protein